MSRLDLKLGRLCSVDTLKTNPKVPTLAVSMGHVLDGANGSSDRLIPIPLSVDTPP